jgi:hypothetical protein
MKTGEDYKVRLARHRQSTGRDKMIDWKKIHAVEHRLEHGKVSGLAIEIIRAATEAPNLGIAGGPPDENLLTKILRLINGKPFADKHADAILKALYRFDRRFLMDLIRAMDFVEGQRGIAQEDALSILSDYQSYLWEQSNKHPDAPEEDILPTATILRDNFLKRKPPTFQSGHKHSTRQIRNLFKEWKLPLGKGKPGRPKK